MRYKVISLLKLLDIFENILDPNRRALEDTVVSRNRELLEVEGLVQFEYPKVLELGARLNDEEYLCDEVAKFEVLLNLEKNLQKKF